MITIKEIQAGYLISPYLKHIPIPSTECISIFKGSYNENENLSRKIFTIGLLVV